MSDNVVRFPQIKTVTLEKSVIPTVASERERSGGTCCCCFCVARNSALRRSLPLSNCRRKLHPIKQNSRRHSHRDHRQNKRCLQRPLVGDPSHHGRRRHIS